MRKTTDIRVRVRDRVRVLVLSYLSCLVLCLSCLILSCLVLSYVVFRARVRGEG
jgi:hypothetical protein